MEKLQHEHISLERELVNLQSDFDKQKVLFNRALKILFGVLETELPSSMAEVSWAEPKNIADAKQILAHLERGYRIYTLERERLTSTLLSELKSCVTEHPQGRSDANNLAIEELLFEIEQADDSLGLFAANFGRILELLGISESSLERANYVNPMPAGISQATPVELIVAIKRIAELIPLEQQDHQLMVELTDALDESDEPTELIKRLHSIVELLERRKDGQVEQVSEFLKSMATRLAELQSSLLESQEESQALDESEGEQADKLSQGIADMRSGIAEADNLEQLKSMIASQLDGLSEGFSEFKQRREARINFIEKQYAQLQKRLVNVEKDAVSAHSQIDLEHKLALTDHLTGLPNRRAYEEQLRSELSRLERHHTPFSVLVVDIDHFKQINDNMGHLIGDRALKLVAKVLRKVLRASDFLGRYGGEEFVVLLAESDEPGSLKTAEKLRRAVEMAPFKYEGKLVPIRVSVGVTQARASDTSARLFHRADQALYRAKEGGRNRVESV